MTNNDSRTPEEIHNDRLGLTLTVCSVIIGFFFWPVVIDFVAGESLFTLMANASNRWFTPLWFVILSVTALSAGTMAIIFSKDR